MNINVEMHWDKDWEKKLMKEVKGNLKTEYERELNRLSRTHHGHSPAAIAAELRQRPDITNPPDEWVEAIQDGRRIVVDVVAE